MHRRISWTAMGLVLVLAASSCMRTADHAGQGVVVSARSPEAHASLSIAIQRGCPKASSFRPGPEGAVAYVADGRLHVLELSSGRDRVLVRKREAPVSGPVAFSPDGRWIAFGRGLVVASTGGRVCSPLRRRGSPRGGCSSWRWLPGRNVLIGETRCGRLVEARTGGRRRRLPIRVGTWTVDPSGRYVAYTSGAPRVQQIRLYDLATGTRRLIYETPGHGIAPPWVSEWSPDGAWVLFLARHPELRLARRGRAVPSGGLARERSDGPDRSDHARLPELPHLVRGWSGGRGRRRPVRDEAKAPGPRNSADLGNASAHP